MLQPTVTGLGESDASCSSLLVLSPTQTGRDSAFLPSVRGGWHGESALLSSGLNQLPWQLGGPNMYHFFLGEERCKPTEFLPWFDLGIYMTGHKS